MSHDQLEEPERANTGLPHRGTGYTSIAALESAASDGDSARFLASLAHMAWEKLSAEDFIHIIKLALKAGAHIEARQISERALQQYPDDRDVKKFARVLAPPRVISSNLPPDPGVSANHDWLKDHGSEYSGQWVALRSGDFLGAAGSVKELVALVGDTKGVLLIHVAQTDSLRPAENCSILH